MPSVWPHLCSLPHLSPVCLIFFLFPPFLSLVLIIYCLWSFFWNFTVQSGQQCTLCILHNHSTALRRRMSMKSVQQQHIATDGKGPFGGNCRMAETACSLFKSFAGEVCKVFGLEATGRGVTWSLIRLCQGGQIVADFAIHYHTKAHQVWTLPQ